MIDLKRIHPVTDFLRNYKAFLARIKETGQPEVLTVNGRPEYVILDADSYQELRGLAEGATRSSEPSPAEQMWGAFSSAEDAEITDQAMQHVRELREKDSLRNFGS